MSKFSVVISGLHYPVTMLRYFWEAFLRRDDVDTFVLGPYFQDWIPWNHGMSLPMKYVRVPNYPLPPSAAHMQEYPHDPFNIPNIPKDIDLWLQIDAGWHFLNCPPGDVVAHIQTDPHVLKGFYRKPKAYSDVNFCMQGHYIEKDEVYLPYAYDPTIHYPEELEKEYDACLIGLNYDHRRSLMNALERRGIVTKTGIGIVYDEYRKEYNKSKTAVSWSSGFDLPCRVWESFGMGIPTITNRLSDLNNYFLEDVDYLGFSTQEEAIEKVEYALSDYDKSLEMAHSAWTKVKDVHTWDNRVQKILEICGLL